MLAQTPLRCLPCQLLPCRGGRAAGRPAQRLSEHAAPCCRRRLAGRRVINIGSVVGSSGNAGQVAYSASKAVRLLLPPPPPRSYLTGVQQLAAAWAVWGGGGGALSLSSPAQQPPPPAGLGCSSSEPWRTMCTMRHAPTHARLRPRESRSRSRVQPKHVHAHAFALTRPRAPLHARLAGAGGAHALAGEGARGAGRGACAALLRPWPATLHRHPPPTLALGGATPAV